MIEDKIDLMGIHGKKKERKLLSNKAGYNQHASLLSKSSRSFDTRIDQPTKRGITRKKFGTRYL